MENRQGDFISATTVFMLSSYMLLSEPAYYASSDIIMYVQVERRRRSPYPSGHSELTRWRPNATRLSTICCTCAIWTGSLSCFITSAWRGRNLGLRAPRAAVVRSLAHICADIPEKRIPRALRYRAAWTVLDSAARRRSTACSRSPRELRPGCRGRARRTFARGRVLRADTRVGRPLRKLTAATSRPSVLWRYGRARAAGPEQPATRLRAQPRAHRGPRPLRAGRAADPGAAARAAQACASGRNALPAVGDGLLDHTHRRATIVGARVARAL